jgi:predicted nucleotidyltransferase
MIEEQVIISGIMGSRSVGTNTTESDYDSMSVVLGSEDIYLGMDWWGQQGTKENKSEQGEHTSYELTKFLRLCQGFNPNVIPLLWLRDEDYTVKTEFGKQLIENRDMFNSKVAYHAFAGYAHNQMKKMGDPTCGTGRMGEARKALREKYGYDTKYAYHAVRLLRMCLEFFRTNGKELNVWRKDIDAHNLLRIRNGEYPYETIMSMLDIHMADLKRVGETSLLPDNPDKKRIRDFCKQTLRNHLVGA